MAAGFFVAFCTMMSCLLRVTKLEKVKIVEEPAVYRSGLANYYQPGRSSSQADNTLKARVKPSPVSGPPHLKVLAGHCYSLVHNGYKYEFCPFNNVTQKEQAVRWNAFAGILGVWKEWVIVNNTFQAMLLANGDMCPGEKPRQTKMLLKCGDVNKVVSVSEPVICQYEMQFETPLACPLDAFLVYPALTAEGRREWEKIEEALFREELTIQGYNKYRRRLFQREHFIPLDRTEKEKVEDKKQVNEAIDIVLTNMKGETAGEKTSFKTKEECSKAYAKLLAKVESLKEELSRKKLSCTDSKHSTPTNSSITKIVEHR